MGGREISFGEKCRSTVYFWSEAYNRDLGLAIWNKRTLQATEDIGKYSPNEEQLIKATATKYHGGPETWYWNEAFLKQTPRQWVPLSDSGGDVGYANEVYEAYVNRSWANLEDCPCP